MRNTGLDILKFICAFLVVYIHAPIISGASEYIIAISRIAVPVFIMITGYFYSDTVKKGVEKKSIIKLLKLFMYSNIFYFVFNIFITVVNNESVIDYIINIFTFENIFNFVVFNDSLFNEHLWYIGAILYVLLIMRLFRKVQRKILYCFIPVLLIIDLILGKYSYFILDTNIDYIYVRNFAFVGLPYFLIGDFVKHHEKLIRKALLNRKVINIIIIALFVIINIAEVSMFNMMNIPYLRDHYISTTPLAIFVFIYFLNDFKLNTATKYMAKIGKVNSTDIYVLHPVTVSVMIVFTRAGGMYDFYALIQPFAVFLLTYIVSCILIYIKSKCNMIINKKTVI